MSLTVIEHQGADTLADLGAARLAGAHHRSTSRQQPLLEEAQLRRLACTLATFEHHKNARMRAGLRAFRIIHVYHPIGREEPVRRS